MFQRAILAVSLSLITLYAANAASQQNPAAPPDARASASVDAGKLTPPTIDWPMSSLLANADAKAVIDRIVPGLTSNQGLQPRLAMTLREIARFPQAGIDRARLAALQAEFAKLPPVAPPPKRTAAPLEEGSAPQPFAAPLEGEMVVYRGVNVIDGSGGPARPGMAIIVDGGTIKAVVPESQLPALGDAEIVDLKGLFAIPGLIDSHVHLATPPNRKHAEELLRREIYGGVTAVRDMADDTRAVGDLARAATVGELASPDIYYAALMAGPDFFDDGRTTASSQGGTPGQLPWMLAVTPKTDLPLAIAMARGTYASGIKLYADLAGPLVAKITAEAHRQHIPVWAHATLFPASPKEVVDAGVDVVSHACLLAYQASDVAPKSYRPLAPVDFSKFANGDNAKMAELFRDMRSRGTILDATNYLYVLSDRDAASNPQDKPHCTAEISAKVTSQAFRAGVLVSAGTDNFAAPDDAYPSVFNEMIFMAEKAGMPAAQVIRSATAVGAMTIGQQARMGAIEAGKLANLVFLAKNPLDDIRNLRSVVLTVKRGERFARRDFGGVGKDEASGSR